MTTLTGSADFRIRPLRAAALNIAAARKLAAKESDPKEAQRIRLSAHVADAIATVWTSDNGKVTGSKTVNMATGKLPLKAYPITLADSVGVNIAARTITVSGSRQGAPSLAMDESDLQALFDAALLDDEAPDSGTEAPTETETPTEAPTVAHATKPTK